MHSSTPLHLSVYGHILHKRLMGIYPCTLDVQMTACYTNSHNPNTIVDVIRLLTEARQIVRLHRWEQAARLALSPCGLLLQNQIPNTNQIAMADYPGINGLSLR